MRRLTRNPDLADDLAQVTFIKAYKQQGKLNKAASARAWIFQIAYRSFLDEHRKTARRHDLTQMQTDDLAPVHDHGAAMDITRAMNSLPAQCRAVVMLCLSQGLTHSEAADVTGLPLGTVKSHVARGKSKLRAFLTAYEVK